LGEDHLQEIVKNKRDSESRESVYDRDEITHLERLFVAAVVSQKIRGDQKLAMSGSQSMNHSIGKSDTQNGQDGNQGIFVTYLSEI